MLPTAKTHLVTISQQDFLQNSQTYKDKVSEAFKTGFCYLEIPAEWTSLVAKTVDYANHFQGYQPKGPFQAESFYEERHKWGETYPAEVCQLAEKMNSLGLKLLTKNLEIRGIPEKLWMEATGKASQEEGQHFFSLKHYRPEKKTIGLKEHKDFGLITVLFINKEGLEAHIDGEWIQIAPKINHFVVNIGQAYEMFINKNQEVNALLHRVRQIQEDRISFGAFIDPVADAPLYQLSSNGQLEVKHPHYGTYLAAQFAAAYSE